MNKKLILTGISFISSVSLVGFMLLSSSKNDSFVSASVNTIWYHYAAVAATESAHGSREFWASNSDGCITHTLIDPEQESYVEKDFSTYESFASLTRDDDRYLPPLPVQRALGMIPVNTGNTITYGLYPQTNINNSSLISALNSLKNPESNGWYLYEDEYYVKLSATPLESIFTFDNGETIEAGKIYWFKCEPIVWNILNYQNEEYFLLSSLLLDVQQYSASASSIIIDEKTIYENNYKHSDIREWLNNNFYNSAFALNSSFIETTNFDNNASTTNNASNQYACENIQDKVFLPSYKDYIDSNYGFSTSASSSDTRICKTTDWARARGVWYSLNSSYLYNGNYWTRSPYSEASYDVSDVRHDGRLDHSEGKLTEHSVRPCISLRNV